MATKESPRKKPRGRPAKLIMPEEIAEVALRTKPRETWRYIEQTEKGAAK